MSLSTASWIVWIWLESSLFSLVVMLAAMTGLVTPHARPRAALELTKMYGTFCDIRRFGDTSRKSDMLAHLLLAQQR